MIWGMERCLTIIPGSDTLVAHYGNLVIPRSMGGLKLSEDTSTLLSPAFIDEFVTPYTQKVLEHFGGGYIHYCGKNDYLLEAMLGLEKVYAINFGNPEMHDMEAVLSRAAQAGKIYYGWVNKKPDENDRDFFKRVRDISHGRLLLTYEAENRDTAPIIDDWEESGV